jgi:hypothetical protein
MKSYKTDIPFESDQYVFSKVPPNLLPQKQAVKLALAKFKFGI